MLVLVRWRLCNTLRVFFLVLTVTSGTLLNGTRLRKALMVRSVSELGQEELGEFGTSGLSGTILSVHNSWV